jgi:predicted DNA-binding transcriptional regulator YafY
MNYIHKKERLEYLLELIEKGKCFSVMQVSLKFNCSGKTVERMIEELRYMGHEIIYCRKSNKYKLLNNF